MPQAPVHANGANNAIVQGPLAMRKLKVKNIDPRVVTGADLQKLFSKCGALISARFDTNEFGQFLGTATVIYTKASCASRAIKDYNMAQIDNRTMKVEFASTASATVVNPERGQPAAAKPARQAAGMRKQDGRIGKSGRGRTLNVMGSRRR